jgi:hypothetical protein
MYGLITTQFTYSKTQVTKIKKKKIRVTYEARYKELLQDYQRVLHKLGEQTKRIIKLQNLLREAAELMEVHAIPTKQPKVRNTRLQKPKIKI